MGAMVGCQGHTSITLIGHSAGSMLHVAYVSGKPSAAVKNTILISLNYFGQASSAAERDQLETKVKKTISSDAANELSEYKLAFCKKYMARAEDFLSYYRWSRQAVLDALQSVQIPVTVIIGSKDDRMDEDWIATLQAKKVRLKVVQGAGHFFDQAYEFDLLEAVETILEEGE